MFANDRSIHETASNFVWARKLTGNPYAKKKKSRGVSLHHELYFDVKAILEAKCCNTIDYLNVLL